jgi:hypothetical protein
MRISVLLEVGFQEVHRASPECIMPFFLKFVPVNFMTGEIFRGGKGP